MDGNKLCMNQEEEVMDYINVMPQICLKGLRKTREVFSQGSWSCAGSELRPMKCIISVLKNNNRRMSQNTSVGEPC
jgi:hypothetical protein